MQTKIMTIFTQTPLHVGAGSSVGAIDMPVIRERHTQIPIVPGSGLKGVLRDLFADDASQQIKLFGSDDNNNPSAGELLIGEARALFFPVRSAKGMFAWITSPIALARYARDAGLDVQIENINEDACVVDNSTNLLINGNVVLEEYAFKADKKDINKILNQVFTNDPVLKDYQKRLVIVSDGIFSHFCANACEVQQRIRIDEATGVVAKGALFNQENVPAETLMYAVIGTRKDADNLVKLSEKLVNVGGVIQLGGDETIGLGFCSVKMM